MNSYPRTITKFKEERVMIVSEYTYKGVYVQVNHYGLHQVFLNNFPCFSTKKAAKEYINKNN